MELYDPENHVFISETDRMLNIIRIIKNKIFNILVPTLIIVTLILLTVLYRIILYIMYNFADDELNSDIYIKAVILEIFVLNILGSLCIIIIFIPIYIIMSIIKLIIVFYKN